MAIVKKPKAMAVTADSFVTSAPDAGAQRVTEGSYDKGIQKGHKRQISITIAPELLKKADEAADAAGIGRSAYISMAIYKALKQG